MMKRREKKKENLLTCVIALTIDGASHCLLTHQTKDKTKKIHFANFSFVTSELSDLMLPTLSLSPDTSTSFVLFASSSLLWSALFCASFEFCYSFSHDHLFFFYFTSHSFYFLFFFFTRPLIFRWRRWVIQEIMQKKKKSNKKANSKHEDEKRKKNEAGNIATQAKMFCTEAASHEKGGNHNKALHCYNLVRRQLIFFKVKFLFLTTINTFDSLPFLPPPPPHYLASHHFVFSFYFLSVFFTCCRIVCLKRQRNE